MFIEKENFLLELDFRLRCLFSPSHFFSTHRYSLKVDFDPALEIIVTSDGGQANYLSSYIFFLSGFVSISCLSIAFCFLAFHSTKNHH
jgi:hypothetical protein